MALDLDVEIKHSGTSGAWVSLRNYVLPSFSSGDVVAERRLGELSPGLVTFTLIDRDTDQTTRYWLSGLATSTTIPEVRVKHVLSSTTSQVLFYGRMKAGMFTYEGDVLTSFTATSLLGYADDIDAEPAVTVGATTYAALGQYSGTADNLATQLVRKLACLAGTGAGVNDVRIDDYDLAAVPATPVQTDVDWNHEKRYWGSADPNGDNFPMGDVYPAEAGVVSGVYGFTVQSGILYRLDTDTAGVILTEVKKGTTAITTTAFRLLRYVAADGTKCMLVVNAEKRHSYSPRSSQAAWGKWVGYALTAAGAAAFFLPGIGQAGALAAAAVGAGMGAAVNELATRRWDAANSDSFYAVTSYRILSIGDGSNNATTGVGAALDLTCPAAFTERYKYVPADSVAVWNRASMTPQIMSCVWNDSAQKATPWTQYRSGTTWVSEGIPGGESTTCGKPTGGAAMADNVIFIGTANGYLIMTPKGAIAGDWSWITRFVEVDRPPSRYVCGQVSDSGGGEKYALFAYGNATNDAISQHYIHSSDYYSTPPASKARPILGSTASTNFAVHSSATTNLLLTTPIGADTTCSTCIYEAKDTAGDDRQVVFPGVLYADTNNDLWVLGHYDTDDAYCLYPMPLNDASWRPPAMFLDAGQSASGLWRMVSGIETFDNDRVVTDLAVTSRWAKARVHHDFVRYPVSIGQALREIAASFWCYLRVMDTAAPTTADQARVISRHSWTPADAGDITTAYAAQGVRVDGIEYYDGAACEIGGRKIKAGTVGIGKSVYSIRGGWLTANWARAQAAEVVARYPRRSTLYPYGRRIFVPDVLTLLTATTPAVVETNPIWTDTFKSVGFSALTGVSVNGIIQSVGFDVQNAVYPLRVLEYAITGSVGDGVTFAANEPAATVTAPTLDTPGTAVDPTLSTSTSQPIFGWLPHSDIIAAQANPSDGPCVYQQRVYLPHGLSLQSYQFGLVSTGTDAMGAVFLNVFTDVGGTPGTEYADSEAVAVWDGVAAGCVEVFCGDGVGDQTRHTVNLPPGTYWLVAVIDENSAAEGTAIIKPAIDWLDGGEVGKGHASYKDLGAQARPGFAEVADAGDTATDKVPAIYLKGDV